MKDWLQRLLCFFADTETHVEDITKLVLRGCEHFPYPDGASGRHNLEIPPSMLSLRWKTRNLSIHKAFCFGWNFLALAHILQVLIKRYIYQFQQS